MIVIMFLLIWTGIYVPYRLSFLDTVSVGVFSMECLMDGIFLIDIVLNFYTAYYDEANVLITNKKVIALKYLKSWFTIDLISRYIYIYILIIFFSLPFQILDSSIGMTKAVRLLRLPRIYKMIKVIKLIKMFNFVKPSQIYEKFIFLIRLHSGN